MSKVERYLKAVDAGEEEFSEVTLNRLYDEEEAYLEFSSEKRRQRKYRNGGMRAPKMVW